MKPSLGGVSDQRDVVGEQPSADGVAERAADHHVDLVHGLGCKPQAASRGMEQRVVQRVEVVGSEPPQPDSAEDGQHVTVDVAVIAGVGTGGEHDLLAR